MEPKNIQYVERSPLNRAFFAINHYVSTGEHLGQGIATEMLPGVFSLAIPVNTAMEEDVADFEAFEAKVAELCAHPDEMPIRLVSSGKHGTFALYTLIVPAPILDDLARKLREKPGPKGWGSMKATIDQYDWREK